MSLSDYWLCQWIDEYEIQAEWEVSHVLNNKDSVERLFEILREADKGQKEVHLPSRAEVGDSIVAGSRIDLSGTAGCSEYECMVRSIDVSFKRVWHYFDRVVVQGTDPRDLADRLARANSPNIWKRILSDVEAQVKLVLHLRDIGADKYVVFAYKPHHFCQDHWLEHARELGIEEVLDDEHRKKIVSRMIKDSHFESHRLGKVLWTASLSGPGVGESVNYVMSSSNRPSRKSMANLVLADSATAMIADVGLSKELMLPLVEPASVPWVRNPRYEKSIPAAESVALELQFPVFSDISISDFLKLRKDEQPYFERFRAAVREAISSRLVPENAGKSAGELAQSIENDFLRPGLADIERRVRANRKALVKKGALSLAIGASAATIGALSSIPLMLTGGAAALGASVPLAPLINRYIDEKDTSIPMSDLYFLWNLGQHTKHRSAKVR